MGGPEEKRKEQTNYRNLIRIFRIDIRTYICILEDPIPILQSLRIDFPMLLPETIRSNTALLRTFRVSC